MNRERRKIVDEILSKKLCETGCFMERLCIEGYDYIEYRWDYVRLSVDQVRDCVRIEVDTYAGVVPIEKLANCKRKYFHETEEEFRECIQHIYDSFVDVIWPKAMEMIEDAKNAGKFLGNLQTQKILEESMQKFDKECKGKSDEQVYQEMVEIMQKSYQIKRKIHKTDYEIDQYFHMEHLACMEFGEWVIRTQGGKWKAEVPYTGYNQYVLVHPENEKKMVDINDLFRKRCMKRELTQAFSYKKDLDFWKNIK